MFYEKLNIISLFEIIDIDKQKLFVAFNVNLKAPVTKYKAQKSYYCFVHITHGLHFIQPMSSRLTLFLYILTLASLFSPTLFGFDVIKTPMNTCIIPVVL